MKPGELIHANVNAQSESIYYEPSIATSALPVVMTDDPLTILILLKGKLTFVNTYILNG